MITLYVVNAIVRFTQLRLTKIEILNVFAYLLNDLRVQTHIYLHNLDFDLSITAATIHKSIQICTLSKLIQTIHDATRFTIVGWIEMVVYKTP